MRLRPVILTGCAAIIAGCSRAPEKLVKAGMALAEEDRVFIANVEARGLVLNRRGFPALTAAIRSGDAAKIAAFFSPDFSGEIFDETKGGGVASAAFIVERRSTADEGRRRVPAKAAVGADLQGRAQW